MKPNQTRGEEQKQLIFQPGSVIWYLWTKDKDKIKSSSFIPQCFTCKELDIDVFAPQQIPLRICLEDSHRYRHVFGLSGPWKVVERSGCYLRPAQVCQQIPGDLYGYLKGWHENEPYPMYQHACGECICIRNAMMYGAVVRRPYAAPQSLVRFTLTRQVWWRRLVSMLGQCKDLTRHDWGIRCSTTSLTWRLHQSGTRL